MILSLVTSRRGLSFVAFASASALAALLTGCSGAPDDAPTEEPVESTQQSLKKGGGGGTGGGTGTGTSCLDRYQSCYIGCGVDHPDGDLLREGCEDSCDAAYRLCTSYGGGGGGGVVMW